MLRVGALFMVGNRCLSVWFMLEGDNKRQRKQPRPNTLPIECVATANNRQENYCVCLSLVTTLDRQDRHWPVTTRR